VWSQLADLLTTTQMCDLVAVLSVCQGLGKKQIGGCYVRVRVSVKIWL